MTDYDEPVPLKCPHCGEWAEPTTYVRLEEPFNCAHCGGNSLIGGLKTPSGKSVLDHMKDIAKE
jgi:hypothetical protein